MKWGRLRSKACRSTSVTVAYYYVEYGTNLAFLSRPNENYCPQALEVACEGARGLPGRSGTDGNCRGQRRDLPDLAAGQAVPTITPMPTDTPAAATDPG